MIKKSLQLKAQYAQVKEMMDASLLSQSAPYDSSRTKPTASLEAGELGSFHDGVRILATGQSRHVLPLVSLAGLVSIELKLSYLSQRGYRGLFGLDRMCCYEKHFVPVGNGAFKLMLPDGRGFVFVQQDNGSFLDVGGLGVEVERVDPDNFMLHYYDGTVEHYSYQRLVQTQDSNANRLSLQYTEDAKLHTVHNDFGAKLDFHYNAQGFVEQLRDQSGRVWKFTYTESMLTQIRLQDQHYASYTYKRIVIDKDAHYLLESVKNAAKEETLTLAYDAAHTLSAYTESGMDYSYTQNEQHLTVKTDAQGKHYSYGLDTRGLISVIVYPDGTMESEAYDEATATATMQTRGGYTHIEVYDVRARLLTLQREGKELASYTYEGKNPHFITALIDQKKTYYSYDERYNLLAVTHPDKSITRYTYTSLGEIESITDAKGNTTTYAYNEKAQLVTVTDATGAKTVLAYDALFRVTEQVDSEGGRHSYQYNAQDDITAYVNPADEAIRFDYSKTGKLQSLTDPANRKTRFDYDAQDRLIEKRYPNGKSESYTYTPEGNISTIHRVDGTTVGFTYDINHNITQITAKDAQGREEKMHYTYDALSNLEEAYSPQHQTKLRYNDRANIIQEIQDELSVHTSYQENQSTPSHLHFLGEKVSYEYTEMDNLKSLRYAQKEIAFSYDANQALLQRKYPNKHKEKYSYDAGYNLTELQSQTKLTYGHDSLGRIISKQDSEQQSDKTFTYNSKGALTQAGERYFTYDKAGNRADSAQQYNILNQLMEDRDTLYAYDDRGNLMEKLCKQTKHRTLYRFNLFDQLIKVKKIDQAHKLIEGFSYTYDALNRRVSKTTYHADLSSITHHYLYEQENIVAILDHNKEILATIIHDTSTDTPLSITTHQNEAKPLDTHEREKLYTNLTAEEKLHIYQSRQKRTYYYHRDHQGSITALTDEEGNIVESFLYDDAYGTILDHHQTVETYNPYCYTGREFDSQDLYYYRARYYDPSVGRFISQDPIEFMAGDVNFYRYVGGDPVNFVDPSGLIAKKYIINGNKYILDFEKYDYRIEKQTGRLLRYSKQGRTKPRVKKKQPKKAPKENVNSGVSVKGECKPPSWMKIVKEEKGIQRNKNQDKKGSNPRIMDYHDSTTLKKYVKKYNEMQSWCGSFASWVMKKDGKNPPAMAFRAKSWKNFGKKCNKPVYGAIGVKTRNGGGHVSFAIGKSADGKKLYMLGGNQTGKSMVTVKEYKTSEWNLGFYVPEDYDCSKCELPVYTGKAATGKDKN